MKARSEDERELMSLAATVPHDDRENIFAKVEDLSRPLTIEYLKEVGSDLAEEAEALPLAELGRRMGVVGGTREAPFPINMGLMFFHPEPWRFFPVTQIDVVWFPEGRGGDRFYEKEFRGPLHEMLREALGELLKELELTEDRGTGVPKIVSRNSVGYIEVHRQARQMNIKGRPFNAVYGIESHGGQLPKRHGLSAQSLPHLREITRHRGLQHQLALRRHLRQ